MNRDSTVIQQEPRSPKCVWMEAGVVDFRLCDRDLDCDTCPFDRVMHPGTDAESLAERPAASPLARGVPFPDERFYDRHHLWARVEAGAKVRVGVDALAASLIGRVHGLTLPSLEQRVGPGISSWELIARAGLLRLPAPISGTVTEINPALLRDAGRMVRDPYNEGWAFVISPSRLQRDLRSLAWGGQALQWLEEEMDRTLVATSEALDGAQCAALPDGGGWDPRGLNLLSRRQHLRLIHHVLRLGKKTGPKDDV